jgi:hypothetical protein
VDNGASLGQIGAAHNKQYGVIRVDLPVAHGYLGAMIFDLEWVK